MTKDQSLVQRMVDAGKMTQEQAEKSEHRNIILQALGPEVRVRSGVHARPARTATSYFSAAMGFPIRSTDGEIAAMPRSRSLARAHLRRADRARARRPARPITLPLWPGATAFDSPEAQAD